MSYWLSAPVESLVYTDTATAELQDQRVGTLIVGSGYGAAMAALALVETREAAQNEVVVFERGDEYLPQDFPRTIGDLPGFAPDNVSGKNPTGLWDIRYGKGAVTVAGNGLGGTSLVNASVAVPADTETLEQWPASGVEHSWHNLFSRCYEKIYALLGVSEVNNAGRFNKYQALRHTVAALDPDADIKPAQVAINFDKPGQHSVDHDPCNHCGNCVVGCHSGAKQSLNMNAWPLARQQGVELYTGARVISLTFDENEYTVHCALNHKPAQTFKVKAARVILSAGSVGSTEILMRSTELKTSQALGKYFSANGDGLIFTAGQKNQVNAVAETPDTAAAGEVGPTIIGIARTTDKNSTGKKLTIEDGAVPYAMAEVWRETLTMQSYVRRYISGKRTAWHKHNPQHDTLASSDQMAGHSQVLLTMGFDNSPGILTPNDDGNVVPEWPERQTGTGYYANLHKTFTSEAAKKRDAYNGGEYHTNPLTQPLPEEFNTVFEGAEAIPKSIVTVHPLGGCIMADSINNGVVNHNGQVYRSRSDSDSSVYENLYVLDGSIVPGALGVNPMVSISALSYVLASRIVDRPIPLTKPFATLADENRKLPSKPVQLVDQNKTVEARFNERLLWNLNTEPRGRVARLAELQSLFNSLLPPDTQTIVLDVAFYFDDLDNKKNSLDKWLSKPESPLRAKAVLMASDRPLLHESSDTFVPMPTLMEFTGEVILAKKDKYIWPLGLSIKLYRTVLAVLRFFYYRPYAVLSMFEKKSKPAAKVVTVQGDAQLPDADKSKQEKEKTGWEKALASVGEAVKSVLGFIRVGSTHSDWRYLSYQLTEIDAATPLIINGQKKLAFTPFGQSVWQSLLKLPANFSRAEEQDNAVFDVDLLRITRGPSPLQITSSPSEPASWVAMGGFAALTARLVGATHFWSFGAHNYHRFIDKESFDSRRMKIPPATMSFLRAGKQLQTIRREEKTSCITEGDTEEDISRLVRYREDNTPGRPAVLLVHGLAHSSEIFWPEHNRETYVQYLLSQGYDVWLLDHRASGNSRKEVDKDHTWDQIALIDIPWAVKHVYKTINTGCESVQLVHVFSHCIGAGAMAMAVLSGELQRPEDKTRSMIGSLVPHAVTPWVFSSCENRTRANVWNFVKDFDLIETVDPRVHNDPLGTDVLLDRIATSTIDATARKQWPFLKNLFKGGIAGTNEFAMVMYFRYTVFWGRQWVHENVSDKLKKRFATMVGEVPAAVLQQTFFSVRRKLLVSQEARNSYVRDENFASYWSFPTFFLHGQENKVFDVESSRLSAFRLARLRHEKIEASHGSEFSANDYKHHGVWLKTVPDYGHMDMMIGENASQLVAPMVHEFIQASLKQNTAWEQNLEPRNSYALFASLSDSRYQGQNEQPLTRTRASKFPFTGPVLSYANKHELHVWAESDDYDAEPAEGLTFSVGGRKLESTLLPATSDDDSQIDGAFWTHKIEPAQVTGNLSVSIEHSHQQIADKDGSNLEPHSAGLNSSSLDLGRQRDIDHSKGVSLNLTEQDWFKRLQTNSDRPFEISFFAASCLHPGSPFSRDISDSVFAGMWSQLQAGTTGPDFLLLLGDQIYADATAGVFDPKTHYERYRSRYREAFGARHMRCMMAHLPTYFVVDDHAFYDNYSGLLEGQSNTEYLVAQAEALNFQGGAHKQFRLWSQFEIHQQAFFCFDTRFERQAEFDRNDPLAIIGAQQQSDFRSWLDKNQSKSSLFLCTGSPLVPVSADVVQHPQLSRQSDTLIAYPGFLSWLADQLSDYNFEQVFILSGDPHLSCFGEVTIRNKMHTVKLVNVVSSALNAPYPFANAQVNDHKWESQQQLELPGSEVTLDFRQTLLSSVEQQFSRLAYQPVTGALAITVYSRDGLEIESLTLPGTETQVFT